MNNAKLPGTFKLWLDIVRKPYLNNKPDLDNKFSGFISFISGFFNFGRYIFNFYAAKTQNSCDECLYKYSKLSNCSGKRANFDFRKNL